MSITYQEHLIRKAKQQLQEQGRIDMCLVSTMVVEGLDVTTLEKQLMEELENEQ